MAAFVALSVNSGNFATDAGIVNGDDDAISGGDDGMVGSGCSGGGGGGDDGVGSSCHWKCAIAFTDEKKHSFYPLA